MVQQTITYTSNIGFHIRPIGQFSHLVKSSNHHVSVTKNDITVSGERMMQLLRLEITKGDKVTITVEGKDEQSILDQLVAILLGVK